MSSAKKQKIEKGGMEKIVGYSERVIEYGFYGLVFLVPLVFTTSTFELFEFPKMILVYFLAILIVAAFLVKSVCLGKLALPLTPLDKPIAAFVLASIVSTIFSIDKYTSIFGYYTRFDGGLLSLLAYVSLYYVFIGEMGEEQKTKNKEQRTKKFVKALLLSSAFVSVYGVLQHFGIDKDYWVQDVQRRVFSTLGQPNWLAAYLIMVIPVSLSLVVENHKSQITNPKQAPNSKLKISKLFYISLPIVLYTAFWFTYSRSGLLGFGAAMITFLIFLSKENFKRHWRPLLLVGLTWAMISIFGQTPMSIGVKNEKRIPKEDTPLVAPTDIGAKHRFILTFTPKIVAAATPSAQPKQPPTGSTVQIRLAVWKGTFNLIKDNLLIGTGPETFAYAFLPYRPVELNQTAEWEFLYNKAHNEYLNVAACTGLLGLGAYLWIIGKFVLGNLKRLLAQDYKPISAGVFAGWVGVLVSNFFGFSVVVTSLLFWLYMALGSVSGRESASGRWRP